MRDTQRTEVPVQDATTVILLRDTAVGPEAFTMTRALTMAFSAGATVFPGGKVDHTDEVAEQFFSRTDMLFWQNALGATPAQARRLLIATLRETFEEAGVLFARPACGGQLVDARQFEEERERIEKHQLSFADFLTRYRLVPDFSYLRPWSRWITPAGEPKRYDTRFLLAALPPGQEAVLTTAEATSVAWLRPLEAMELFRQGSTYLMPPTWAQFHRLQDFSSVDAALTASPEIAPIEPEFITGSDPLRVRFPQADAYYST